MKQQHPYPDASQMNVWHVRMVLLERLLSGGASTHALFSNESRRPLHSVDWDEMVSDRGLQLHSPIFCRVADVDAEFPLCSKIFNSGLACVRVSFVVGRIITE